MLKGKVIKFRLDTGKPAALSAEAHARLAAIREENIDCSDIPECSEDAAWYRPGPITTVTKPESR